MLAFHSTPPGEERQIPIRATIPIEGNIVAEYRINDEFGNTEVLISDAAYVNNTPEDNKRILERAARASLNIILHNQSEHL